MMASQMVPAGDCTELSNGSYRDRLATTPQYANYRPYQSTYVRTCL